MNATTSQLSNPTPDRLRTLVLDYLCHNCYTSTAHAFAHDSAVRHLDADGDEIMSPPGATPTADLAEDVLRLAELRSLVRRHLLAGRVDAATDILNAHFPTVLSAEPPSKGSSPARVPPPQPEPQPQPPSQIQYVAPTSVESAHLNLNLRILAFIEASRTVPLPSPSPSPAPEGVPSSPIRARCRSDYDHDAETKQVDKDQDGEKEEAKEAAERHQAELLSRAQKLYTAASMLERPSDRATYLAELGQVGGLLAYPASKQSPMAIYLSQARREAVADQIDSAILHRMGCPAASHVELYARYTASIWSFLVELRVKSASIGAPPAGVHLAPFTRPKAVQAAAKIPEDKNESEIVPSFDLCQFLDAKT